MDEVMQAFRDLIREEFGCETYSYQDILWERYVYQLEELYRQSRIRQCGCDDYEEYLYKCSGLIPETYDRLVREKVNYFYLIRHRSHMVDTSFDLNPEDMPKKIPSKRKRKPYEQFNLSKLS